MSIKNKLVFGFGLIILFIVIMGLFNKNIVHNIETNFNNISKVSVPSVEHITNAILYLERSSSSLKTHLLSKSVDNQVIDSVHLNLKNSLDSLTKLQTIYPENKSITNSLDLVKQFSTTINETIETQNMKINILNSVYETEAQEARAKRTFSMIEESQIINYNINTETLNNIFTKLLALENEIKENSVNLSTDIIESIDNSVVINLLLTIIILVLACVIAYLLVKSISNSLDLFTNGLDGFFSFLNKESKEAKLINLNTNDEIGKMSLSVNTNIERIQRHIKEDEHFMSSVQEIVNSVKNGKLTLRLDVQTDNPSLQELQLAFNGMLDFMSENICGDVKKIQFGLEEFQKMNFAHRIPNPTGKTSQGLNNLADLISEMLTDSKTNALILEKTSQDLMTNTNQLSKSSNEAATSLEETSSALGQITTNIRLNTQNIIKMATLADGVTTSANEGEKLANQTTIAMEEINSQVSAINESIAVIDQIAFQTNILSLNAAVEAATAGEAGKGFAVVAGEVRNLASRSAEAAKEIKAIVERATSKANQGKNIATDMIKGYTHLNNNISQTIELISGIQLASQEQLNGIEQINDAVTKLDKQTQQNATIATDSKNIAKTTLAIASKMVENTDNKQFVGKEFKERRNRPVNTNYSNTERRSIERKIKEI
jgi:methyl-accepting chemotaxis protein